MLNAEISRRRDAAISRGVGMQTQVYVSRASGAEVWDVEGRRYIDFAAGIAVVNTGHCHPNVMEAVRAQSEAFTHTCHQVLPYENYIRLAERLNDKVPGNFDKKTVFVTTGAEAVENAIKIARAATGRSAIIAFGGGSGLDLGKMIAFMAGQSRPVWDFEDIGDWWTRADADAIVPNIAIPTTAGTGSEVGRAGVLTNSAEKVKKNTGRWIRKV